MSSEQFISLRKRRCLKGFELSQRLGYLVIEELSVALDQVLKMKEKEKKKMVKEKSFWQERERTKKSLMGE
ncbi:hypothetical protein RJ641_018460 [Dillenia turbinata]|uniref:Uncharacterized protein n=1 Tax=Dillenia turbinata TaxID=194707 RepID=A0AAN8UP10_9MAGN